MLGKIANNFIALLDKAIFFFDDGDGEYWLDNKTEGRILNESRQRVLNNAREESIKALIPMVLEREQRYSGLLLAKKQARVIAEQEFERAKQQGYVDACNMLFLERVA